jgi:iron complex outermembrane receptor protein
MSYQPTKQLLLDGDVFTYHAKDAILSVPLPSGKTQPQNVGSKDGYGLGLEAQWQVRDNLKLLGNYTFQTATDQDGPHIPNAPRHKIYLRTDWQFLPHWNFDAQANWVGKRYRLASDTRPTIGNYTTVDLTLRYQQEKQPWEVGLSVRNLFDEEAKEPTDATLPNDLPLAGRSWWGEVRYRF